MWYDLDKNGVVGPNEPGIHNVTVTTVWFGFDGLEGTPADNITYVRTTNLAGLYLVNKLPLGNYRVTVDVSTVPPTPTATYDLDSGLTNPDSTTLVSLTAARPAEPGADFGYFVVPFIGDTVWLDFNGDGVQNNGEPGLAAVTLTALFAGNDGLFNGIGDIAFTTTTDADGLYAFTAIPPGRYRVSVTGGLPAGVTQTGDPDGTLDGTTEFVIAGDEVRDNIDFGYRGPGALGDFVWDDLNGNGRQDTGEPGISGVTVQLFHVADGALWATTTTDVNGFYSFPGLIDGQYTIHFSAPAGYVFTTPNQGDDLGDSDADPATGFTAPITLGVGVTDNSVDAGLYRPVAYRRLRVVRRQRRRRPGRGRAGHPWRHGHRDLARPDGVGRAPAMSSPSRAPTDANGIYHIDNLPPGNYTCCAVTGQPAGLTVQTTTLSSFSLVSGVDRDDIDFGSCRHRQHRRSVYGSTSTAMACRNSNEPGIANATVHHRLVRLRWPGEHRCRQYHLCPDDQPRRVVLRPEPAAGRLSRHGGRRHAAGRQPQPTYDLDKALTNLMSTTRASLTAARPAEPGRTSATPAWCPSSATPSGSTSMATACRTGEPGLAGVTLTATWAGNDGLFNGIGDQTFTTTTDANGHYAFAAIPPGRFRVSVTGGLPAGVTQTGDPDGTLDGQTESSSMRRQRAHRHRLRLPRPCTRWATSSGRTSTAMAARMPVSRASRA